MRKLSIPPRVQKRLAGMGVIAFLFFLIKGLAWLILPAILMKGFF